MQCFLQCFASENVCLYSKNGHNSEGNYLIRNINTLSLVLKTSYKKLVLKYQDNTRFPSLCMTSENVFLSYFYSGNGHNSVENGCIGKNLSLF